MAAPSSPFHGACLCGAVHFEVAGATKWCAHCHCTMCRRAHGAAFVTYVGVHEHDLSLEGEEHLRWYSSSDDAERGFCTVCGTTLFFRGQRLPGEMHIVRSNFEGPIDREPATHVFYNTHVDWVRLADDLPRQPG